MLLVYSAFDLDMREPKTISLNNNNELRNFIPILRENHLQGFTIAQFPIDAV